MTSVLASSVWLDDGVGYVQKTLDTLAQDYYASAFSGEMGSDSYNKALQSWLNEQTGGLLQEQVSGLEFTPETVMALATTIYYRAKWAQEFLVENPMKKVPCPKLQKRKVDALTKEQAQRFFGILEGCDLEFRCMLTRLRRWAFAGVSCWAYSGAMWTLPMEG